MEVWKAFKALLPEDPLQVATVTAVYEDGTSLVTYPGGGTARLRGSGFAVAAMVWVKSGQIIGPAPDLTVYDVEV
jgi:hypothetical protein